MSTFIALETAKNRELANKQAPVIYPASNSDTSRSTVVHEKHLGEVMGESRYRVLVPLNNAKSLHCLIAPAVNAALRHRGRLVLLHVILVSRHTKFKEEHKLLEEARKLLSQATKLAHKHNIEADTEVRLAYCLADAVINTTRSRGIDLIVMGWEGTPSSDIAAIGSQTDKIMNAVPCDVMVVQQKVPAPFERLLLPIASLKQVEPLLNHTALLIDKDFELDIVHYFHPEASDKFRKSFMHRLEKAVNDVRDVFPQLGQMISINQKPSEDIVQSIVEASSSYDAVVLGATRSSWIKRHFQFDKPNRIARRISKPLILISPRSSRTVNLLRAILRFGRSLFFKLIRWMKGYRSSWSWKN